MKAIVTTEADITVDFLRAALTKFKSISSVKILNSNVGQLGEVRRLELTYDQQTEGLSPSSLYIKYGKVLPEDNYIFNLIKQCSLYENQVQAYKYLKQNGIHSIPEVYYSKLETSNTFTLILQDLSTDYKMVAYHEDITLELAQQIVLELARIHGKFLNLNNLSEAFPTYIKFLTFLKPKQLRRSSIDEDSVKLLNKSFENNVKNLIEILNRLKYQGSKYDPREYLKLVDLNKIIGVHESVYRRLIQKEEILTLIHWDVKTENMMYRSNEFKIFDWQFACVGNPIVDVGRFLLNALPASVTGQQFNNLLQAYAKEFQLVSGRKLTQQFLDQSLLFYLLVDLDLLSDLTGHFKAMEQFPTLQEAFKANKAFQILMVLVSKIFKFYVERQNHC